MADEPKIDEAAEKALKDDDVFKDASAESDAIDTADDSEAVDAEEAKSVEDNKKNTEDGTSKGEEVERPSFAAQLKELVSTILWAVGIALVLRTFIFQPFHIPSGSMLPGLMKGDYIITSKYSLGYGKYAAAPLPFPREKGRLFERKPERGDVIVFRPEGETKNFIKRIVGLPGDTIQMKDGVLHINKTAVQMEALSHESFLSSTGRSIPVEKWKETFLNDTSGDAGHIIYDAQKNNPNDNTSVRTVPAGFYFFMGDNRDYSSDSRVPVRRGGAGLVPAENLMGKAEIVLLSVDNDFVIYKPWTWGKMRGSRFFKSID